MSEITDFERGQIKSVDVLIENLPSALRGKVFDGYHSFDELYEHRVTLYILLLKVMNGEFSTETWRSKKHFDGSEFEGWFILGTGRKPGEQTSYHLPLSKWDECNFAETLETSPEWDGHTSADVLDRLKELY